jgi:hypothetical protein
LLPAAEATPGTVCPAVSTLASTAVPRPDVRAARIAEVVELLAAGIKERPRP